MSRELLNRPRRRPAHRHVRTERVAKPVDTALPDVRAAAAGSCYAQSHGAIVHNVS